MFILIVMCKSIFTMREIIILYGSLLREKRLRKKIPGLIDRKDVGEIYHVIESKLTEEEDE